jgi:molybdate transport system substrate-binding protein
MRRRAAAWLLPPLLVLAAASLPRVAAAETLTVFAASSLQDSFRDIGRAFRTRHPDVRVEFMFAGTSTLRSQLEHGAAADVFASADTLHAGALARAGRTGPPRGFARNRLVLITRAGFIVPPAVLGIAQTLRSGRGGSPVGGDTPGGVAGAVDDRSDLGRARTILQSVVRPGAHIVLADSTVPAGRYARAALERMARDPVLGHAFLAAFDACVASRETNVRAVLAKVMLGEADAGIVYATDALVASKPIGVTPLPEPWNVEADYAAAVVQDSRHHDTAQMFVDFLSGDYARSILRRHGFTW